MALVVRALLHRTKLVEEKNAPSMPTRSCYRTPGPRESSLISSATSSHSGASSTSAVVAIIKSEARFTKRAAFDKGERNKRHHRERAHFDRFQFLLGRQFKSVGANAKLNTPTTAGFDHDVEQIFAGHIWI